MSIVTITFNPCIDKSAETDKISPDNKLRCSDPVFEAGGGGINVSKALKRLEKDSLCMFMQGGYSGKTLEHLVEKAGISYHSFSTASWTRENLMIIETSTNSQYRFVMPGENIEQTEADALITALVSIEPVPEIIIASGSLPPGLPLNFFSTIAAAAKTMNAKFVLDTSGEALKASLNSGIFLIKPNLNELARLSNKETIEFAEVDDLSKQLIQQYGIEIVVVSMGANGAALVTKNHFEHVTSPKVEKKSTVGAGDSMVAGLALGISQKKSLKEILQLGIACGTAATMNKGSELCRKEDVKMLLSLISNEQGHK